MNNQPSLLPPSDMSHLDDALTPTARTEAEAALTQNSITQTDAAGPDPTVLAEDGGSDGHKAYRRPGVARASSANYENALKRAQQASVSSNMSADSVATESLTGDTGASSAFPLPGHGVLPLNYGAVTAIAGESVRKTRSRGLSLSQLAQQQGWSEEEYKRVYNSDLPLESKGGAGYGSASVSAPHGEDKK